MNCSLATRVSIPRRTMREPRWKCPLPWNWTGISPRRTTTHGLVLHDEHDFKGAEQEFKRAIELKPSYATAHQWYFHVLRAESRWDEALKQIEKAVELDPFSQIINLNHAMYYESRRDYAKALELSEKAVELDPNFAYAHLQLAETYAKM